MVKLISITKGIGELEGRSAQDIISYAARVSNPKNQMSFETAPKLLKYCIKNNHWSVFEQASLTFEITTSRGISAQLLRHKSFQFQELSQRYSEVDDYIHYEARRQDVKNRQNSIDDLSERDKQWFLTAQEYVWNYSNSFYKEALERGIAKECSRFLLPLNTKTTLYMNGSVRSWITYFLVRLDKSTQLEHRQIAKDCYNIFKEQLPDISSALSELYPEIFL